MEFGTGQINFVLPPTQPPKKGIWIRNWNWVGTTGTVGKVGTTLGTTLGTALGTFGTVGTWSQDI